MKFTKWQQLEKENLEWFGSFLLEHFPPQDGEFEEYLAHSERGTPIKGFERGCGRLNVWSEAKRWRGRTIHELWEDSFYTNDGSWLGWHNLLIEEDGTPIPEHIKDYIKREIFKGQDAELIDSIYIEKTKARMV